MSQTKFQSKYELHEEMQRKWKIKRCQMSLNNTKPMENWKFLLVYQFRPCHGMSEMSERLKVSYDFAC